MHFNFLIVKTPAGDDVFFYLFLKIQYFNNIMIWDIGGLILCAAIIFYAGKKLSFYGDILSEHIGLGKAWMGLIFMSFITSLPELVVGISSSALLAAPDLAVGDILGSCAFNLVILSILDIFTPFDKPLFTQTSLSQSLAASFSVILLVLAGLGLFLDEKFIVTSFVGLVSVSFIFVYFISLKVIFGYLRSNTQPETANSVLMQQMKTRQALLGYVIFAALIVVSALALPHFADKVSQNLGISQSLAGTIFLATSTSLPEVSVSYASLKRGSVDLAVGNLMGSNIFNFVILFVDDLVYVKGNLLKDASETNLISVFFIIMMTSVATVGFVYPTLQKKAPMSWDTITILGLYLLNIFFLYHFS